MTTPTRLALLAAPLLLATVACSSGEPDAAPATTISPTTAAPSPDEQYLDVLRTSGVVPNVADADPFWLEQGRTACQLLERNAGDLVDARFTMAENLVVYPPEGEGFADPDLTRRARTVVDAAAEHLCPEAT